MKKAMRKVMAFALAAFMLFSTVPSFAASANTDQAKLDKLEELGVIKGEGHGIDGTKSMTRYRSIVMLLRLLGLEDDMLAFDYEGKDTFNDAEGQNGYQARLMAYIKAHQELDIVGFPDGTFRPFQEINSQEYTKILLRALSYDNPEDYTWETVATKAEEIGLVDSASSINLTDEFSVSDLAVLTYDALTLPSKDENITLGEKLNVPIIITELDINSVSSLNSTTQDISLNKDIAILPATDSFKITDEKGNSFDITDASLRTNNTIVRLTTKALKENQLYTLTYNDESYKFVAKAADSDKPELISAIALTNQTVQLTFNEEVDVNAISASNYSINNLDVIKAYYDVDEDENPIKNVVLLITTSQKQGTIYKVEVSNVTDLSGNKIDSDNDTFKFGGLPQDKTEPRLRSSLSLTNTSVKLIFNEDMDKDSVEDISNYEIDGLDVLKAERQSDKNQVILTTSAQSFGTIYKLTVSDVTDLSGNTIDSDSETSKFAGHKEDKTEPKLKSIMSLTNTSIKLIFSEDVDKTTAENIANYSIKDLEVFKAEKQTSGNEVILTTTEHTPRHLYKLYISNVTDLSGNDIDSDYDSKSFAGKNKDTREPRLVDATALNNKTVRVTFNEPVDEITAMLPYNYNFGDDLGYPTKVVKDTDTTDGTVWVLTTGTQQSDIYTLKVTDVTDLSGNAINSDYDTAEFAGIGLTDGAAPKLSSAATINNNTLVVSFNKDIDEDTIVTSNFDFSIESGVETGINEDDSITNDAQEFAVKLASDNRTVTIQFKTATMLSGVIYKVTASDILDTKGNKIVDGTDDTAIFAGTTVGNNAPTVVTASLVNNQTLEILFSEPISLKKDLTTADFDIENRDSDNDFNGKVKEVTISEDKTALTVYYTGDTFDDEDLYNLTVSDTNITDLLNIDSLDVTNKNNETLFSGTSDEVTSPMITGVVAYDENTIDIFFDQIINSSLSSSNVNDIVVKLNGEVVNAVDCLVREEGNSSDTLRVFFEGTPFDTDEVYTLVINENKIQNKNGVAMDDDNNSEQFSIIDIENKKPELTSAVALSNTKTKVTFSEIVKGVDTSDKSTVFALSGITKIASIEACEDGRSFILTHEETTTGKMVTVSINDGSSITDEAGVGSVNADKTVKFVAK